MVPPTTLLSLVPSNPNKFVIQYVETDPFPALSFKSLHLKTNKQKKSTCKFSLNKEQKKITYGTWQGNWVTNPDPVQLNNF